MGIWRKQNFQLMRARCSMLFLRLIVTQIHNQSFGISVLMSPGNLLPLAKICESKIRCKILEGSRSYCPTITCPGVHFFCVVILVSFSNPPLDIFTWEAWDFVLKNLKICTFWDTITDSRIRLKPRTRPESWSTRGYPKGFESLLQIMSFVYLFSSLNSNW